MMMYYRISANLYRCLCGLNSELIVNQFLLKSMSKTIDANRK